MFKNQNNKKNEINKKIIKINNNQGNLNIDFKQPRQKNMSNH